MCCRLDVDILLKACWKFRELFMHSMGPNNPVDPFDYTTITSVCMGTFRAKWLPKEWEVLLKKKMHHPNVPIILGHVNAYGPMPGRLMEMHLWKFSRCLEIG